jgi:hypothetical protein
MTLPTNDNFANRELSIDELETIAAGGIWSSIEHAIDTALRYIEGPILKYVESTGGPVYAVPHKNR